MKKEESVADLELSEGRIQVPKKEHEARKKNLSPTHFYRDTPTFVLKTVAALVWGQLSSCCTNECS